MAGHVVAKKDRKRIRCQHFSDCQNRAVWCEHVYWDAGNTKGVSFFYSCGKHAPKKRVLARAGKRRRR